MENDKKNQLKREGFIFATVYKVFLFEIENISIENARKDLNLKCKQFMTVAVAVYVFVSVCLAGWLAGQGF